MAFMLKELSAASSPLAKRMSKAKTGGDDDNSAPRSTRSDKGLADAFDVWLQQGLHKLYDSVAKEPVPDELLKLIDRDLAERKK
jgi:anti-sigma factor NepR-like protein